jgi:surfactin synthase thioesterase subunit
VMTTQLLATELANLIQESKRKHNDLRQVGQPSPSGNNYSQVNFVRDRVLILNFRQLRSRSRSLKV